MMTDNYGFAKLGKRSRWGIVLLFMFLLTYQIANATTDYIFFSVNGDTSATSMIQGDTVAWGANCDTAATMTWEIWLDINLNSAIDSLADRQITYFYATDGDTTMEGGPGDINPIPDGWFVSPPMLLGIAPGLYIFRATDHTDSSTAQRSNRCFPIPSPPNSFRGRISIDGHPAPDSSYLRNIWVEANYEDGGFQIWSGLTDDSGYYAINIGPVGTGLEFRIGPFDMPGFVTPGSVLRTASGVVNGIDFTYSAPADSIYGQITDQFGTPLMRPIELQCRPRFEGPGEKQSSTSNGTYVFYFGPSEYGMWNVGLNPGNIIPDYLCPQEFEFDNGIVHSQRHDFICYTTDTVIFARVTEVGNYPQHRYLIIAQSDSLRGGTYAISDTGAANLVTLAISSLDSMGWRILVSNWDDRYPIPPGYIPDEGQTWNRHPGDTVALNFIFGKVVSDTITLDPGDPPANWNNAWVHLNGDGKYYGGNPDSNGAFTIYADTGVYEMGVNLPGFLFDPFSRSVHVTVDTSGGLGFVMNSAHCHVTGTLVNIPLPLAYSAFVLAHTGSGENRYRAWVSVDSLTGAFALDLCDGDWAIDPPFIPDRIAPAPMNLTIAEYPDTARTVEFTYTTLTGAGYSSNPLPDEFALLPNHPNPFNSATAMGFNVPSGTHVVIEIFNILGGNIRTLVNQNYPAGSHRIIWDGADDSGNPVSSGIYFYRLRAGNYVQTRRMALLK